MKKIFIISSFFILVSCNRNTNNHNKLNLALPKITSNYLTKLSDNSELEIIKVDPHSVGDDIFFDDFFELDSLVFLDDKSVLGEVSKMEIYENKIYIFDRFNTEQIYCYNSDGKLLWEFKSKGGGPLEYKGIIDFSINTIDKTLDVYDGYGFKIIKLSLENGKITKVNKVHSFGDEMVIHQGNYLFYNVSDAFSEAVNFKLLLFNDKNEVISRNLPYSNFDLTKGEIGTRSLISDSENDEILITETYNDTIYELNKENLIKPKYFLDYGDYGFNFSDYIVKDKLNYKQVSAIAKKGDKLTSFADFLFRHKSNLFFTYIDIPRPNRDFRTWISCIYNEKTKKIITYLRMKNTPLSFSESEQIMFRYATNDYLVQIINPNFFDDFRLKIKNGEYSKEIIEAMKKQKSELYKLIVNTTEYSNPVLALYKYKHEE